MKIGIISLGLIGGSLFKCLCEKTHEIYAVTRNQETISKAKALCVNVSDDINILKHCDLVFVAAPISKTIETLDKLESIVSANCIVLDCASVKEFVMQKQRPYKFIGSHPMAGTELSGYDASFKSLFDEAKWVMTPADGVSKEDIETAKSIISETGAVPIIADAKEHDMAVALISHMPLVVSQALFKTAQTNSLALKLAAGGFRDMTRIAMSNLEMAQDMRKYNGENINKTIKTLEDEIHNLINCADTNVFEDIKNNRKKMYSSEGKNII